MKILAHTSFIGTTGYANHARSFFCALNKFHTVRVRNLTIGNTWKGYIRQPHNNEPYLTEEMKKMLVSQTLFNNDNTRIDSPIYNYDPNYKPDVHIVLVEMNNHYFYDDYDGYKIAFNVWESTRYPDDFFQRLHYFDEVWVPTQWQFNSLMEQGYPKEKISIVTEGVDVDVFKPLEVIRPMEKFRFLLFGRWDYRKSTTEIIRSFGETFKNNDDVELICSVENPYPYDGLKSTKERCDVHNVNYKNIKYLNFPSRKDYIKYLREGHVFLSCSRSEGWNLPLIEAMSCGTPSIYSDWGGQLQFAQNKGIPVKISHMRNANITDVDVNGEYCEPDFEDLKDKMLDAYNNYEDYKKRSVEESKLIHDEFNWNRVAQDASNILIKHLLPHVFVTTCDLNYMPITEKLVKSLNEFSDSKIIVYGVNCDVPFDYPNLIKRRIDPPVHSEHDKWYWKQYACIESLNEDFEKFVWVDGDIITTHNIDNIGKYFNQVENYPISDIHRQEEFFGIYDNNEKQLFNENISKKLNIQRTLPFMHVCLYVYNKKCKWWFEEIIKTYKSVKLENYKKYFLWNDEGIDNLLRWEYGYRKHLPLSNFDTSECYSVGKIGNQTLNNFHTFWNEDGEQNFNEVFGYQHIPKDKSNIIYFHGNKILAVADEMIEYIKMIRDNSFYRSEYFYTDVYKLENFGKIKEIEGGTLEIASKYGFQLGIYHEIYNLREYYKNREKAIHEGDVVVDLGGNMGIFNRWAYNEGASEVISFEPDKRYFKLLQLNSDPRSVLFNAAVSDTMGTINLYETEHYGGSNIFGNPYDQSGYPVRSYTLDYLFETLIDKIDFLKVDIEGAEHKVFNGISDENLMKIRTIAMEYHHSNTNYNEELRDKFIQRLNKLGFNSYLLFLGTNNDLQMIYFTR